MKPCLNINDNDSIMSINIWYLAMVLVELHVIWNDKKCLVLLTWEYVLFIWKKSKFILIVGN